MSIYDRMMAGLLGQPDDYGVLTQDDLKGARQKATMSMAAQLLNASGPSDRPIGLGQALGSSILAGQQAQGQASQDALQSMLLKSQIEKNSRMDTENQPNSVREYEYAKKNGFNGTFQEWTVAGGQSSRPSSVQEWEIYQKMNPDDQQRYLEMKRNPNFFVKDVNGAPTVIRPTVAAGTAVNPLASLESTAAAGQELKRRENIGAAVGTGEGSIKADIMKKGSNAVSTEATLDIAEPLIDVATGSAAGSARDKVNAFFGEATDGAQAIAQLQVLQANLMTSMPRMEGPQSDRDVELYSKAAGQIGDPAVPGALKKAALKTIRTLQQRYQQRAGISPQAPADRPSLDSFRK
jgi:hypothetical protein